MLTFAPPVGTRTNAAWDAVRPATVILLALACVCLMLRRRHPLLAFSVAAIGAIVGMPAGGGIGIVVLVVAAYSVAVYRSSRTGILAAVTAAVLSAAAALVTASTGAMSLQASLNAFFSLGTALLVSTLVGVNIGNRKRYVAAILDTSRQLWEEREHHARLAASAERTRIAREMHDVVSHSLTVVVALAEGATATSDADRSRAATARIATTARGALDEMRAMLGVLRDETDPEAPLVPLDADAVGSAVAAARSAGLPVTLRTTGPPITERHARLAVARVVQEGLTNVLRHAPQARTVEVAITRTSTATVVEVVNDGVAAAPSGGGFGLRGLHERAARLGGTARAGLRADGRWHVRLEIPTGAADMDPESAA